MDEPVQTTTGSTAPAKKERTHILSYILILFIAAFFLMALSFLSHQRSNEQVLGQLSTSFNALENLQTALEENVRLEGQIDVQRIQIEELEEDLESIQESLEQMTGERDALQQNLTDLQSRIAAMDALAQLQQLYISGDLETCRSVIVDMEATGLDKLLPAEASAAGGAAPAQLYQQLKDLVNPPAETQPAA